MTTTIAPQQRLTIVKHLAGGKSPDVVSAIVDLPRATIVDIGSHHGYPDIEKLKWAADILAKKIDDDHTAEQITERPDLERAVAQADRRPVPTPSPNEALTKPDEIRVLLNTAKAHESKRIQAAADKVFDDVAKLRKLIADDETKHAARRKAAADKAAARAEVDRLEAQLREAKAKLRGDNVKPADTDGPSSAEMRAWAAANDVACPSVGRVPAHVREAYGDAHAAGAA